MGLPAIDVRYSPKSGHCREMLGCPLCARLGHRMELFAEPLSGCCLDPLCLSFQSFHRHAIALRNEPIDARA
jgi:hypothetical protein